MRKITTITAIATIGAGIVAAGLNVGNDVPEFHVPTLPACEFEDSDNCIWDANTRGNGEGESYITYRGETYYSDPVIPTYDESTGCWYVETYGERFISEGC